MRIIKPSFEIWDQEEGLEGMQTHIERCGRVCYASEPKGNPVEFVQRMINSGHGAMLEFGVIYLTTNEVYTRCILDKQSNIPFSKRNTSDWSTTLEEAGNTVYAAKKSIKDTCFIFPHGICHDVSKNLEGKERIIIRFDILGTSYED